MRTIKLLLICTLISLSAKAQRFNFASKEAISLPTPVIAQLCRYIEVRDGAPMTIGGKYLYVPVFNVLNRSQKQFTDGLYYFTANSHDSGQLFINQKGKLVILRNGSVSDILADYNNFLKQHKLPEIKQIAYLAAIAAFMQFRYKDQQMLVEAGALLELK
jgi:hypothetical protein